MDSVFIKNLKRVVWAFVFGLPLLPACLADKQDLEIIKDYDEVYNRKFHYSDPILVFYDDFVNSDILTPSVRLATAPENIPRPIIVDYFKYQNENLSEALWERGYELTSNFLYFVPYEIEWNYHARDSVPLRKDFIENGLSLKLLFDEEIEKERIANFKGSKLFYVNLPSEANSVGADNGMKPEDLFVFDHDGFLISYNSNILNALIAGSYPNKYTYNPNNAATKQHWQEYKGELVEEEKTAFKNIIGNDYLSIGGLIPDLNHIYFFAKEIPTDHLVNWSDPLQVPVFENGPNAKIKLNVRPFLLDSAVKVRFKVEGSAELGSDYTIVNSVGNVYDISGDTIIIQKSITSASLELDIIDDMLYEGTEAIVLTILEVKNAEIGEHTQTVCEIEPSDYRKVDFVGEMSFTSEERTGLLNISVWVSEVDNVNETTVEYQVVGGTATSDDYVITDGSLTIPKARTSASFPVQIINDQLFERDETIIIRLKNPKNAVLGNNPAYLITIEANDDRKVSFLETSHNESEKNISYEVQLMLSEPDVVKTSYVQYSITGDAIGDNEDGNDRFDYTELQNDTLFFAAGQTLQTLKFTIKNDTEIESDERIAITLSNPVNCTLGSISEFEYIIEDDDARREVFIDNVYLWTSENAGEKFEVKIKLSDIDLKNTTRVAYTLSGSAELNKDYLHEVNTIQFPTGQDVVMLSFMPINDIQVEFNEEMTIVIEAIDNAVVGIKENLSVDIWDDDSHRKLNFSLPFHKINMDEGNSMDFKVVSSNLDEHEISFDLALSGNAVHGAGMDYSTRLDGVSIPIGNNQKSFIIPVGSASSGLFTLNIADDLVIEPNESIIITITNVINGVPGGRKEVEIVILDND